MPAIKTTPDRLLEGWPSAHLQHYCSSLAQGIGWRHSITTRNAAMKWFVTPSQESSPPTSTITAAMRLLTINLSYSLKWQHVLPIKNAFHIVFTNNFEEHYSRCGIQKKNPVASQKVEGSLYNCSERADCTCAWKQWEECVQLWCVVHCWRDCSSWGHHLEKGHYYKRRGDIYKN